MATMNVSLPDELRDFAESRVSAMAFASSSEYIRDLIRRDRETVLLRSQVLDGIASGEGSTMDSAYFEGLRRRARGES